MRTLTVAVLIFSAACTHPNESQWPVRWTKHVALTNVADIERLLAEPVRIPCSGCSLRMKNDFGDEGRLVTTGQEWLQALEDGLGPMTTYDLSMSSWFQFSAGTLARLRYAKPSRASYVKDVVFSTNALWLLPATLHNRSRSALEDAVREGRLDKAVGELSFGDLCPGAVVESATPNSIVFTYSGMKVYLKLAAWGDFDHDGIEDLLCEYSLLLLGGSGRFYNHVILSRLGPGKELEERTIEGLGHRLRRESESFEGGP